ncbi:MAG TPA: hypothetical protein VEK37_14605 [Gemmatimonadaceae bacterium]|nr:hypothetical protein [Gemmatimonadaceae bacterium]
MTITPGKNLGPYEILDAIGAGGMGEVYKTRDTRLRTFRGSCGCWRAVSSTQSTLATTVVPIERMLDGYEQAAYRTTVTAIMIA